MKYLRIVRLVSWIFCLAVTLVYLALVHIAFGDQLQQQHYIQSNPYLANQQAQAFKPYTIGQTYQSLESGALTKQARDLSDYVTFLEPQLSNSQQANQLASSVATQNSLNQFQSISRRQQLPQASQTSSPHNPHPFIASTSNSLSSPGKVVGK